jgi:hypothetical protein
MCVCPDWQPSTPGTHDSQKAVQGWGGGDRRRSSRWGLTHIIQHQIATPGAVLLQASELVLVNISEYAFAKLLLSVLTLSQTWRHRHAGTCRIVYPTVKALFITLSVPCSFGGPGWHFLLYILTLELLLQTFISCLTRNETEAFDTTAVNFF